MRDDKTYYCKKTLMDRFGMTERVIKLFLSIPCKMADNPHYKRAPKMKLYSKERVEAVIKLDEYKLELDRLERIRQNEISRLFN